MEAQAFVAQCDNPFPRNYKEVMRKVDMKQWECAMDRELASIEKHIVTFETLYTSGQFAISKIQHLQKNPFPMFSHAMPASNFLRTRQSAKRVAGTRIHKPTENKCASTRVRHHQKTILDVDSPVHADSTLSVHEAMDRIKQ